MDIGRMNKRISFFRYEEKENQLGQISQKLTKYKTVWASVEPVTSSESTEAQKIVTTKKFKIYTRFHKNISENSVIKYKSRTFYINSIVDVMEKHEMLLINAYEKVGDDIEFWN